MKVRIVVHRLSVWRGPLTFCAAATHSTPSVDTTIVPILFCCYPQNPKMAKSKLDGDLDDYFKVCVRACMSSCLRTRLVGWL